jgi:hypothetical protein
MRSTRIAMAAIPPTTPPTIAPMFVDDLSLLAATVDVVCTPMAVVVYIVVIATPLLDLGQYGLRKDTSEMGGVYTHDVGLGEHR